MPNEGDKLNRIEELKNKLFSKNYKGQIGHTDKFKHIPKKDIPDSWDAGEKSDSVSGPERFFMKTPIFKNFFIFSLAFFVLTIFYASYVFFAGGNTVSNENIDISVTGNNYTAGGDDLNFVVAITNKNNSSLDLADLVLEYPKDSGNAFGKEPEMERSRISLGTIPAGAVRNENVRVVLFGEEGTVSQIKITLEYRVEGSNAIFVKKKDYDVTISSTPLTLSVEAPSAVSPNENITLKVKTTLNATRTMPKMLLRADYPLGFVFVSSTPPPTSGNNVWSLGDMAPGVERNITVVGKMVDVTDGEEKVFRVYGGSQGTDKYEIGSVFNSLQHSVVIEKPFIEGKIFINGVSGREYATSSKTPIHAEIHWTNNLDTKVNDLSIVAKLSGSVLDRRSIASNDGFYDSARDAIVWDKNSLPNLSEISPGESGVVSFTALPLPLLNASGQVLADPVINIEVSVSGKQLVSGYATADLNNTASAVVRVISDVGFTAKAQHFSGAFTNIGPIPPRVQQKTTYTISWAVSNTSNNISKGEIRSTLPQWINFENAISPNDENLIYNPSTRELVWNVSRIPKGTGVSLPERKVSFQISFSPSLSQVGTTPILINDAILTGHDDFANVDVRVIREPLRTFLSSDPQFPTNGGTVIE